MQSTPSLSDKYIFWAMSSWILGFFLMPVSRQHYQLFLLTIVLGAFWLILTARVDYKSLLRSRVVQASLAYAGLFFISIFWSNQDWSDRFKEIKTVLYLLFFIIVFLYAMDGKTERLSQLMKLVFGAALLSLLIGFYYFYGYQGQALTERFAGVGRLWNQLWAAAIYGGVALVALAVLLDKYQQLKPLSRLALLSTYAFMMLAVFLTQSRMPAVAVAMMTLVTILVSRRSVREKILVCLGLFVISLVTLVVFFPVIQEFITNRGQSYRLDLWLGFWEQTRNNWLFGHGGGSDVLIHAPGELVHGWYHYHSIYVGSLIEMGLIGLLLHVAIIVIGLYQAWKLRQHLYVRVAALVFIFACIIGATFGHGIVTRMNTQWLLFWMPLLVIAMYELKEQRLSVRVDKLARQ